MRQESQTLENLLEENDLINKYTLESQIPPGIANVISLMKNNNTENTPIQNSNSKNP